MATTKGYASLKNLSTFLDGLKRTFASLSHTHKWNDLENKPQELDYLNGVTSNIQVQLDAIVEQAPQVQIVTWEDGD